MGRFLELTSAAENIQSLKAAYHKYKTEMLAPSEGSRKRNAVRYKAFWNDTLDKMTKMRKHLYKRAMTKGTKNKMQI